MAGQNRAKVMVTRAIEGARVTEPMEATIHGMLHAIVKTPELLPTLNAQDFQRLIDIVVPQAVAEVCDEIRLRLCCGVRLL